MSNPNNCATCSHKQHPDGGHCYMFRDEPQGHCLKHTGMRSLGEALRDLRDQDRWLHNQQARDGLLDVRFKQ